MLKLQTLLSLLLLAVPSLAAGALRGVEDIIGAQQQQQQQKSSPSSAVMEVVTNSKSNTRQRQNQHGRQLQDGNQIKFRVTYTMTLPADTGPRVATEDEASGMSGAGYEWIRSTIMGVQATQGNWTIATIPNYGLSSITAGEIFYETSNQHVYSFEYTASFAELESPEELGWMISIQEAADTAALLGILQDIGDDFFDTMTAAPTVDMRLIGSLSRNQFEASYVLPYRVNWNFNTTDKLASPIEYDAAVNATEQWTLANWKAFYGTNTDILLENIDIRMRFTAFQPSNTDRYQQQLALYVQLVIGANNVTDVPSVTSFLETIQLFWPVSDFVESLEGFMNMSLPADQERILPGNQQSLAVSPTYDVVSVSESQSRNDPTFDEFYTPISWTSLNVVIDNPNIGK